MDLPLLEQAVGNCWPLPRPRIGMLLLIGVGALVLFETGPFIANFVAVGLVGLAAFGLWAYRKRRRNG